MGRNTILVEACLVLIASFANITYVFQATPNNIELIDHDLRSVHTFDEEQVPDNNYAVIITKVLWLKDIGLLKQWICLISHAFDDEAQLDIAVAAPVNLTVALEAPPLEEQLAAMTKEE
eukprot:14273964-Ditylum_brightwellii.AAC.1